MPELVLQLTRAGFLALLWLFVLFALRVVRSDLYAASGLRVLVPGGRATARTGRGRTPRQLIVTQGALAGTRIIAGLPADPDRPGRRLHPGARRRLRLHPARARSPMQGEEWYVEDLGSTNGTYLDRAKVTGPTRVPLGVPVRIGKTVIELRS